MKYKVVETFSGIGSQARALKNIEIDYEVVNTVEWDITAIYAYDLIHNGVQDLGRYSNLSCEDVDAKLLKLTLSGDGKKPICRKTLMRYPMETKKAFLAAIERTNNLIDITKVRSHMLPDDIDILTYSFPCQDLSISGFWHGNKSGIDRDANNRSSLLWEIERLLQEFGVNEKPMPRYLVMENVTNIRSARHNKSFSEWKHFLAEKGYVNIVYDLCASDFTIPQNRTRTFMISVFCYNDLHETMVNNYFDANNLQINSKSKSKLQNLLKFLRLDYSNEQYREEAIKSIPNNTPSRRKIREQNPTIALGNKISDNRSIVRTITTKQDRHPNSGIIIHEIDDPVLAGKSDFRYLTPRECFLLMGFSENDYQILIDNNLDFDKKSKFFTFEKLIKLAGNSIVVDVLEAIFSQIIEIDRICDSFYVSSKVKL